MNPLLLRCVPILLVSVALARADEPEDLNALLEPIRAKHRLPALAAASVVKGQLVAIGATGVRAFGHPEKVTVEDRWNIGSCTKSMTASLAGMMVEGGALRWDTKIGAALPQLAQSMHADYKDVTLEQLLTHRSGTPGRPSDSLLALSWAQIGSPVQQRSAYVGRLVRSKSEAPAGSRFIYSNQGFAIAGVMLEEVARRPFEDLLQQRLFAPLGLKSVGFGAPGTAGKIDQPRGHNLIHGQPDPVEPGMDADLPPALAPAACVHLSIGDFARYAAWHADAKALLKPATFEKLHTPPPESYNRYAMGWGVHDLDWAGGTVLMHNGTNTHFFALMWVVPSRDAAYVAVTNLGGDTGRAGVNEAIGSLVAKSAP